jgi:hypothetical protein
MRMIKVGETFLRELSLDLRDDELNFTIMRRVVERNETLVEMYETGLVVFSYGDAPVALYADEVAQIARLSKLFRDRRYAIRCRQ